MSKKRNTRPNRVKKFGEGEKFGGGGKKFWEIWPKKGDFRHTLEIYELEQSFFKSKKSKEQVFRSNFLFFRSKKSKK